MKPIDLYLILTSYCLTVTAAALAEFLRRRAPWLLMPLLVAVALLVGNTLVGTYVDPDNGFLGMFRYLIEERDLSSVAALIMGVAAGFLCWIRYATDRQTAPRASANWLEATFLSLSIAGVVLAGQAFLWKEILGVTRHAVSVTAPGFVIDKVADLDDQPTRVATGEQGEIYVAYDYFKKHGAWGGVIIRFWQDAASGEFQHKTVIESPLLARIYGLAMHHGDLYVSRSGFFPKSSLGRVSYESTGAITQLRDLDGDGYFEYANDVVTGLPGVRAPDTMQQNNGIVFAGDGSLFITNAGAADRTLDEHPWGGSILRVSPDFGKVEVFARGFRNPWSITFGPDGELFATDSDVDSNPGDEIDHVVQGAHYGHPFVIPHEPGVDAVGFREPILVGERETVFCGLVYATSAALPEEFRNCLYATDFRRNQILRLQLQRSGDTYRVTNVSTFARVPSPVDMTVTPSGEFYVISRRAQKLYRIRVAP